MRGVVHLTLVDCCRAEDDDLGKPHGQIAFSSMIGEGMSHTEGKVSLFSVISLGAFG